MLYKKDQYVVISIHTPTKGATVDIMDTIKSDLNFNPHSHEGSDFTEAYNAQGLY